MGKNIKSKSNQNTLVLLPCTVCNEFILLSSCSSGAGVAGVAGRGSSGAGHGGNGGVGSHQVRVGAAIGDLYEPDLFGCKGGGNGGLGGGKMKLVVNGTMKIDGTVSCSGQTGSTAYSGGGSGGSIWIVTNVMRGYGQIQVRKLTSVSMRAFLQNGCYDRAHRTSLFEPYILCSSRIYLLSVPKNKHFSGSKPVFSPYSSSLDRFYLICSS